MFQKFLPNYISEGFDWNVLKHLLRNKFKILKKNLEEKFSFLKIFFLTSLNILMGFEWLENVSWFKKIIW